MKEYIDRPMVNALDRQEEHVRNVYGERRQRLNEFDQEARNVFASSIDKIANAELNGEKPVKLFGMFEVPAGMDTLGGVVYNLLSKFGADYLQEPLYHHTERLLAKQLGTSKASKAATVTTMAMTIGVKSGAYLVPFFTSVAQHHKDDAQRTREAAPILDELKGSHSQLAYMMVGASDNTVIAAHKHRMAKVYRSENLANLTNLLLNAGLNLAPDFMLGHDMWKHGKSPDALERMMSQRLCEAQEREWQARQQGDVLHAAQEVVERKPGKFREILDYLLATAGPPLGNLFTARAARRQRDIQEHPSAFEMIVALEQQVSHNPNARVQAPREHRDYSLEAYIMKVILAHQREIAEVDPHFSEIRPALREELGDLVKPIATAIREGQISALTLMHLVGEPQKFQLVRNKGRALATPDEVESMIEKIAGKKSNTRVVDVDDFLSRHDLKGLAVKKAIEQLQGEDRIKVAALFPDLVLEQAGITKDEIEKIKAFRKSPDYGKMLAEMAAVAAHTDEKELKKDGMTTAQIKRLDRAAEQLHENPQAIGKLKSGFTNPDGIEDELIDWALPKIEGKALHLGKIASRGEALLAANENLPERSYVKKEMDGRGDSNPADELADELHPKGNGHTGRERDRRDDGYDNYSRNYSAF